MSRSVCTDPTGGSLKVILYHFKYVPPHVNIFYCLGGITFTCFIVQVATGFAMTFYYRPTVTEAFFSVQYIMNEVNFGWLIRSIHRWSASMMVLMMMYGIENLC